MIEKNFFDCREVFIRCDYYKFLIICVVILFINKNEICIIVVMNYRSKLCVFFFLDRNIE